MLLFLLLILLTLGLLLRMLLLLFVRLSLLRVLVLLFLLLILLTLRLLLRMLLLLFETARQFHREAIAGLPMKGFIALNSIIQRSDKSIWASGDGIVPAPAGREERSGRRRGTQWPMDYPLFQSICWWRTVKATSGARPTGRESSASRSRVSRRTPPDGPGAGERIHDGGPPRPCVRGDIVGRRPRCSGQRRRAIPPHSHPPSRLDELLRLGMEPIRGGGPRREVVDPHRQRLLRFPKLARTEDLSHTTPVVLDEHSALGCREIFRTWEDPTGDMWITCMTPTLATIRWQQRTGRFQRWTEADGMPRDVGTMVFRDGTHGTIWMATGTHAIRFRGERFESFALAPGQRSPYVRDMLVDSANGSG